MKTFHAEKNGIYVCSVGVQNGMVYRMFIISQMVYDLSAKSAKTAQY